MLRGMLLPRCKRLWCNLIYATAHSDGHLTPSSECGKCVLHWLVIAGVTCKNWNVLDTIHSGCRDPEYHVFDGLVGDLSLRCLRFTWVKAECEV